MRVLTHSSTYSQKTMLAQKGLTLRSFMATKLKKTNQPEKMETKTTIKANSKFEDENDFSFESVRKPTTILNESKKIQKSSFTKKPFKEMTNPIVPLPVRTLRSGKVFLEDGTKQTRNYENIQLTDGRTKKKLEFFCFPERDLPVTASHAGKVVSHSCDNDCSTDEEQIKNAIDDLFQSLQECVKEEKETLQKSASKKRSR